MGPRRVGKTVLIHHLIGRLLGKGVSPKNICYFSVDHPIYNGLSLEEFLAFYGQAAGIDYAKTRCFIFFDEVQYLNNWEKHLKSIVDRYPLIRCVASGSAAAALRLKSTESGAGRFTDFLLPPLSFHEYLSLLGKDKTAHITESGKHFVFSTHDINELNNEFMSYLNFGGYPEMVLSDEIQRDPRRYIKSDIIDKVLLRDLPGLYGVQDIQKLNYLFTNLAFNTANEIALEELSQNSGVAKNTIKKYIEYLEAAFLVRTVHRVDRNARRFKRANFFKVYLTNPSIRTALFSPITQDDPAMGSMVETAIFSQWFHQDSPLHYARWRGGEVDIVALKHDQKAAWAVEAKWSDRCYERPSELKALADFCRAQNLPSVVVTTRVTAGTKVLNGITIDYQPASFYCLAVGYLALKSKGLSIDASRVQFKIGPHSY